MHVVVSLEIVLNLMHVVVSLENLVLNVGKTFHLYELTELKFCLLAPRT